MKIVEFSIRRRVTVSMVTVVLIILGMVAFTRLGLDMVPDMESPFISVITSYAGVSSEDIEQNITRPMEQLVATVTGVKELKSISQEGVSMISVEFESGTNLDFAAQDIRDKIAMYKVMLPEDVKDPMVLKFNFADMPILMYGITGGAMDLKDLKDYIDDEIAARLERINGVASAIVFSSEETEILVNINKGKLESRGLAIAQIEQAIRAANINLPSGYMDENHKEYLIRTIGEFERINQIENVIVGLSRNGDPIFLRDIATVKESIQEIRNLIRIQGQKGVMMVITKSSGANTVLVAREVKKTLEKIQPSLKNEIQFSISLDFSTNIEIMANKSAGNILVGGILAMGLIFLFLRNLRPTLAIGFAIPLSVITTFIAFYLVNYTLNLITIGGLALGVGMLVDNAVVVIENIYRHLEAGKSSKDAALMGTSEVGTAIIASTMTTIAVFFPMMFASGMAGTFSRGLSVSVAISLLASLFIALTIIPMMASWFFKHNHQQNSHPLMMGVDKFNTLKNVYGQFLNHVLKKRTLVLILVIALFLISVSIAMIFLGGEFLPDMDRSMVFMKLKMPVGTTLEETNRVIKYMEEQSLKDKRVLSTMVNVGFNQQNAGDSASGMNPAGSYEATLWSYLLTSSKRDMSDKQIIEQWRAYFPDLKEGSLQFIDVAAASMGGSSTSPIEFNLFGRDFRELERQAERIKNRIVNIRGLRDVEVAMDKSKPELQLKIRKEAAARLGLTPYEISRQVQTFTIGTVVSRMMIEGEERDIRVRLDEVDRSSLESLKKLPIMTAMGTKVYLNQVVDFIPALGPVKIERENQVRKISVTANYIERDLSGLVKEILEKTKPVTDELPEGYFYEMGGQYKDMIETFITMLIALILALVLVYAVMASQFESLKYPFIIMFTIPLAFIGVSILLAVSGMKISLPSIMGFIMLAGIAVNNGIVMVDYINQLIARGMNKFEAVVKGAVVRLRPILITSLSTILGMLPMAIFKSEGSEMRAPMAVAIIGGLVASTFLTLFVIPILYTYFSRIKVKDEALITEFEANTH
jgi:HAE1 family hydrophobic/amphiphilic exporter-1